MVGGRKKRKKSDWNFVKTPNPGMTAGQNNPNDEFLVSILDDIPKKKKEKKGKKGRGNTGDESINSPLVVKR